MELKRYLLGELTPSERVSVEARLFLDVQYLSQLEALEDELLDDYVYNDLSATEREKLETHFLSKPGRDEDLKFARALKKYSDAKAEDAVSSIAPEPARQTRKTGKLSFLSSLFNLKPLAGFSFAAATILVLCFILWLTFNFMNRRNQADLSHVPSPTPQPGVPAERRPPADDANKVLADKDATNREAQPPRQQGDNSGGNEGKQVGERSAQQNAQPRGRAPRPEELSTRSLAVLLLPGGAVRGEGESKTLPLPPDVGSVVLQLPLVEGDKYDSYRATLQSGGRTIRVWPDLKSSNADTLVFVPITVPTKLLRQQSYQVKLAGITADRKAQAINTYQFRVPKR